MVTIMTDYQQIAVDKQLTILEAAKEVHVEIPHLYYLRDISEIGTCRACVVELQGKDKLVTACNIMAREGMVIYTNSPKVRYTRRCSVELLFFQHDCEYTYYSRSGNCLLQKTSSDPGITSLPYEKKVMYTLWDRSFPLIRESNKCIKCMCCIQVRDKVQSLQVWDVQSTGSRATVNVSLNRSIEEAECSLCGQCTTYCPVNALHVREDSERAFAVFNDPDKITIVQIIPAVRAAWGESPGLRREEATIEKPGDAFRRMGADYVFDTDFVADLTIMEEVSESLERLHHNKEQEIPMLASRCPGWVRLPKSQYPDMVSHLSASKSPHQMFGTVTKTWFTEKLGVDPSSIYNIPVISCVVKKREINIPVMNDSGYCDVDVVLTTREVVRMIHVEHTDVGYLQDYPLDDPPGTVSGAGVTFGATGGVMEATLRSAYYSVTGENADADAFADARGIDGWKESTFEIQGIPVRYAIVSGLGNTRRLIEATRRKEVAYDFIEVMACLGGYSGGGGQPIHDGEGLAVERVDTLYHLDHNAKPRYLYENPPIHALYDKYLGKSLLELAEKPLHTDHEAWQMPHIER